MIADTQASCYFFETLQLASQWEVAEPIFSDGLRVKHRRKATMHEGCDPMYFEIAFIQPERKVMVNQ